MNIAFVFIISCFLLGYGIGGLEHGLQASVILLGAGGLLGTIYCLVEKI